MDNPYSPYVDRTGGSVAWGANPTNKRGPQAFPVLPAFKPYATPSASPGVASMVNRLRTNPAGTSGAGSGSGASGRGADASGMSIQGIEGIQGIPTTGSLSDSLGVAPESPPTVDVGGTSSISPDSQDQPPTDTGDGTGTTTQGADNGGVAPGTGSDIVATINRLRQTQGGTGMVKKRVGPQY